MCFVWIWEQTGVISLYLPTRSHLTVPSNCTICYSYSLQLPQFTANIHNHNTPSALLYKAAFHDWYMSRNTVNCGHLPCRRNGALQPTLATWPFPTESVNVHKNDRRCSFILKLKSVAFPRLVYTWPAAKRLACWQSTASGHLNKPWECDHHVQANIRHVHPRTNICHLNQSWKKFDNYSLGSLCDGQLMVHLLNNCVSGKAV